MEKALFSVEKARVSRLTSSFIVCTLMDNNYKPISANGLLKVIVKSSLVTPINVVRSVVNFSFDDSDLKN